MSNEFWTVERFREHCKAQQKTIGKMGVKLKELDKLLADRAKAESAMRNMKHERDEWRERALIAEAKLASLGIPE